MKKIISALCMLALLLVLLPKMSVQASEVTTYTEVKFIANVPEEFTGDIVIVWENTVSLKKDGVRMFAGEGYSITRNILGGDVYNLSIDFVADGEWKSDLPAQYEIPNGEGIEIVFNVLDGSPAANILTEVTAQETEVSATNSSELADNGDIDPLTGILKGEVAIQNFIDKVSIMQDDSAYDDLLKVYGWDNFKEYYKDDNSLNTEERWESMTLFEKYIWNAACYSPKFHLNLNAATVGGSYTLNDFKDDAISSGLITRFENKDYPNEELVYEAHVELCEWHYDYFKITGTVYDYYNGSVEYVDPTVEQEASEEAAEVVEDKELEDARNEILDALTDEEKEELGIEVESEESNGIVELLKDNILTIVLLVIIGVLLLTVMQKKRKE